MAIVGESKKRWNELVDATATSQFPSDVMIQILSKLPIKSIIRFESVNKAWYALFTSPRFAQSYFSNTSCLMLQTRDVEEINEIRLIESLHHPNPVVRDLIPPIEPTSDAKLVGSINGLVCLSLSNAATSFALWNPATGKHFRIPDPDMSITTISHRISLGFAYDEETDCYKVIRVISPEWDPEPGTEPELEIYNSRTNTWSQCVIEGLPMIHFHSGCGYILHGSPYWFGVEVTEEGRKAFVMHFDPSDEELRWKYLDLPLGNERMYTYGRIGMGFESERPILFVLRISVSFCGLRPILQTWRMDKEFVRMEETIGVGGSRLENVLGIWRNGETIGLNDHGELVMYDYEFKKATYVPLPHSFAWALYPSSACEYSPSLVPPSHPFA